MPARWTGGEKRSSSSAKSEEASAGVRGVSAATGSTVSAGATPENADGITPTRITREANSHAHRQAALTHVAAGRRTTLAARFMVAHPQLPRSDRSSQIG